MYFILYSSDHSSVRWGEQVFFSFFSDKDTAAQGDGNLPHIKQVVSG